jgi:CPA2 family monovalent cation:H+ antiporter-2
MLLAAGGHDLPLVTTIAAAFAAAWFFGIITHKLRLSPIVGYLIGGIAIGPHTPGFVGDATLAPQLAELGVILLMFGVGMHFHLGDLLAVRRVAIPGAIGQSLVATLLGIGVALAFGMSVATGLVIGMAMAVASTVLLIRVLTDAKVLDTPQGHVAIGWLIVEDILTVLVLVLLPAMASVAQSGSFTMATVGTFAVALLVAFAKLAAMVAVVFVGGGWIVPRLMVQVARLRSRELFTLTVLVMAIAIATAAYFAFGASMALGAFLAGMVVGRSPVALQAGADALPLRDAFAVLFFASVGMLFDPMFVVNHPLLLLAGLGVVLIGKPLAALVIVAVLGHPARTAITVAIALAQIGEFSFILSDAGRKLGLIGDTGHSLLVAVALVSITINPLLFRLVGSAERGLQKFPGLWKYMNRNTATEGEHNPAAQAIVDRDEEATPKQLAVVLGYGPVGRAVDEILREGGMETVVVDLNMQTIESLTQQGRAAIYGDAYNIEVLSQALARATHLIITLPHVGNRNPLIASAKLINPDVKVIVRARYLAERAELIQSGADAACFEEAEVAVALAKLALAELGKDDDAIRERSRAVRDQMQVATPVL